MVKGAGCKFELAVYPNRFVCELNWTLSRPLKGPERGWAASVRSLLPMWKCSNSVNLLCHKPAVMADYCGWMIWTAQLAKLKTLKITWWRPADRSLRLIVMLQCFLESVNNVSQSASRCEEAHIAVFASFEMGMLKAQAAHNTTVSFVILAVAFDDNLSTVFQGLIYKKS